MKYIKDLGEGGRISDIYYCKSKTVASTKNGKTYYSVVLQDKTGTLDCKIWEPNSSAIGEFEAQDYIDVVGEVSIYNGSLQAAIKRLRVADETEYTKSDYVPSSRYSNDSMYDGILKFANMVENPYYKRLLDMFFVEDEKFIKLFRESSAAKSIHHGFVGGLLEHTLGGVRICQGIYKSLSVPE